MKKLVVVCLLGIGLLLQSYSTVSKANCSHRVIDVNITGWVLYASSQTEDGTIDKIEIYNASTQQLEMTEYCSSYSCSVDIGDLAKGEYEAKVYCVYNTYTERFSK